MPAKTAVEKSEHRTHLQDAEVSIKRHVEAGNIAQLVEFLRSMHKP